MSLSFLRSFFFLPAATGLTCSLMSVSSRTTSMRKNKEHRLAFSRPMIAYGWECVFWLVTKVHWLVKFVEKCWSDHLTCCWEILQCGKAALTAKTKIKSTTRWNEMMKKRLSSDCSLATGGGFYSEDDEADHQRTLRHLSFLLGEPYHTSLWAHNGLKKERRQLVLFSLSDIFKQTESRLIKAILICIYTALSVLITRKTAQRWSPLLDLFCPLLVRSPLTFTAMCCSLQMERKFVPEDGQADGQCCSRHRTMAANLIIISWLWLPAPLFLLNISKMHPQTLQTHFDWHGTHLCGWQQQRHFSLPFSPA